VKKRNTQYENAVRSARYENMKLLRTYILKESVGPFLMALLIFTFVMLIGNLVDLADLIIRRSVNLIAVLKLFVYLLPFLLSYTIPMAVLTATLITFGRLSSNNEITAMRAGGINFYRIVGAPITVALILSLLCIPLNDRVSTWAHFASRKTAYEIGIKNPISFLEEKVFIKDFKGYIIYIHKIDKQKKLKSVTIYQLQEGERAITFEAKSGKVIPAGGGKIVLKLFDVNSYESDPDNPERFYRLDFKSYDIPLDLSGGDQKHKAHKRTKEMTVAELKKEITILERSGIDTTPLLVQIHQKFSLAFASLSFVLIGLPLAIRTKRREKSIGFGIALFLIILYFVLTLGGEALALKKIIGVAPAMWLPNILLSALGLLLIDRLAHD